MAIRHFGLAAVTALGGLVACASIAGLDDSDPVDGDAATTPVGGDTDAGRIVTEAGISISPLAIALTGVNCGDSKSAPITITNVGTASAPFSITVPENSAFTLEGADGGVVTGEVEPKGSRIVNLTGKSDQPGNESADVVVKAGDTVQQITASLVSHGAGLVITPGTLDFGEIRKDIDSQPASVVFQNTGNDPITITSFTKADGFTTPTNLAIPGGQQVTGAFIMNGAKKDDAPVSVMVTPMFDTASAKICGPTPTITLKGQRTDQNVTANPAQLDFGRVGCGALSGAHPKLTITNTAPKLVNFEIKFGAETKFRCDQSLTGTVAGAPTVAESKTTELTFSQITAQPSLTNIDETITISFPGADPPVQDKSIKLHADVYGAILQAATGGYPSPYYAYPDLVDIADNDTGYGSIKNVGNAAVCVKYSVSGGNAGNFTPEADDRLDVNELDDLRVTFRASQNGNYSTSLIITHADCTSALGGGESAPFCAPPPTVKVSGKRNQSSGGQCCGHYPCPC